MEDNGNTPLNEQHPHPPAPGKRGLSKPMKIAALVLAGVLVVALGLTAVYVANRKPAVSDSIPPARVPDTSALPDGLLNIKPPQRDKDVDFDELQSQNPDIIGWIELPGTVIDYPVVSGIDNAYYLTHNEYKQDYIGGAIFTDMSNSADFMDPVTVLYGHYMPDESLFTQLHRYEDEAYFDEHRTLRVYTPAFQFNYEIVGAFYHGEENILYEKDYRTPEDRAAFMDWLTLEREAPCYTDLSKVTDIDSFLVLSTCAALDDSSTRYVVVARLVNMV